MYVAVRQRQYQRTDEAGAPLAVGNVPQPPEQQGDALAVAHIAAEAGGVDSGLTTERIHFDTGVVRQGREPAAGSGEAGLDERVFIVRAARFRWKSAKTYVGSGQERDVWQRLGKLGDLAGIAGREQQPQSLHARVAPSWGRRRSSSRATPLTPAPISFTYVSAASGAASLPP